VPKGLWVSVPDREGTPSPRELSLDLHREDPVQTSRLENRLKMQMDGAERRSERSHCGIREHRHSRRETSARLLEHRTA
jgi:hypothetical protein